MCGICKRVTVNLLNMFAYVRTYMKVGICVCGPGRLFGGTCGDRVYTERLQLISVLTCKAGSHTIRIRSGLSLHFITPPSAPVLRFPLFLSTLTPPRHPYPCPVLCSLISQLPPHRPIHHRLAPLHHRLT